MALSATPHYTCSTVEDGCRHGYDLEFSFCGNCCQNTAGRVSVAAVAICVRIHQATVGTSTTSAEGAMRPGHALASRSLSEATGYGTKG